MEESAEPHGISQALRQIEAQIARYADRYGRPEGSVRLLAVSKTKPLSAVREALTAGQTWFGENQLQDALGKIEGLGDSKAVWHFIGPVQSNKTRPISEHFAWCHSLDRLKIAERLSSQRPQDLEPLQVCIQVNIDGEATKAGIAPGELDRFADEVAALPRLELRGLMAIPRPSQSLAEQREPHRRLRELLEGLNARGHTLDTLSAGMTDDMEAAIAEGATIVRIGTAIFGARNR